jgi:hypothetical protein
MKTAVEWLIEQWPVLESQLPQQLLEQAKKMEKQQIIDAFELWRTGSGEKYYNQTFKQQEQ